MLSPTPAGDLLFGSAPPVSAQPASASDVVTVVDWTDIGDVPVSDLVAACRRSHRIVVGVGLPPAGAGGLLDAATLTLVAGDSAPGDARTVGVESVHDALVDLDRTVSETPIAAASLAGLLRMAESLEVRDALIAESFAYSTLQAGPEYARWLTAASYTAPRGERAPVVTGRHGSTLTVELDRPSRHNALDAAMRDALVEALTVAIVDDTVDAVLLSGRGPSFCSGGDLAEFGTTPNPAVAHLIRTEHRPGEMIHRLAQRFGERCRARVHGAVMGGGLELAAFAGRVDAARDARFLLPEMSMGLVPGAGGTVSVARRIGRHRTAWMVLTGTTIDADHALRWGLVDSLED